MRKLSAILMLFMGFFIVAGSSPMLYAWIREYNAGKAAFEHYALNPRYTYDKVTRNQGQPAELELEFGSSRIVLSDAYVPSENEQPDRQNGGDQAEWVEDKVTILINGRDYSIPTPVVIRPSEFDANRYHGYLLAIELLDKPSQVNRLAIVQRIDGTNADPYSARSLEWRLLLIDQAGNVEDDRFAFGEHAKPVYRTMLANFATPVPFGFYSSALQTYPGLIYPLMVPFGTTLAGIVFIGIGLLMYRRASKM